MKAPHTFTPEAQLEAARVEGLISSWQEASPAEEHRLFYVWWPNGHRQEFRLALVSSGTEFGRWLTGERYEQQQRLEDQQSYTEG